MKKYVLNVLNKTDDCMFLTLIFNNEDEYLKAVELLKYLNDNYDYSAYTDYILNGLNKNNINYEIASYDILWID